MWKKKLIFRASIDFVLKDMFLTAYVVPSQMMLKEIEC